MQETGKNLTAQTIWFLYCITNTHILTVQLQKHCYFGLRKAKFLPQMTSLKVLKGEKCVSLSFLMALKLSQIKLFCKGEFVTTINFLNSHGKLMQKNCNDKS